MTFVHIKGCFGPKYTTSAFSSLYSKYGPFKFLARIKHFGNMCLNSRIKFWLGKKCKKSNLFFGFSEFLAMLRPIFGRLEPAMTVRFFAILHHEVVN